MISYQVGVRGDCAPVTCATIDAVADVIRGIRDERGLRYPAEVYVFKLVQRVESLSVAEMERLAR